MTTSPARLARRNEVRLMVRRFLAEAGVSESDMADRLNLAPPVFARMLAEGGPPIQAADMDIIEDAVPALREERARRKGFRLIPIVAPAGAVDAQHAVTAAQRAAIVATASIIDRAADGDFSRADAIASRPELRRATAAFAAVEALVDAAEKGSN